MDRHDERPLNRPIARIVDLAPFLFEPAAEASLERRAQKVKQYQDRLGDAQISELNLPHLPSSLLPPDPYASAFDAEKQSISAHDIWGDRLPDHIFAGTGRIETEYNESQHNPFAVYLKEAAPADSSIRGFDRSSSEFDVCRDDAMKLAGGDLPDSEDLAKSIIEGEVALHKMPSESLNDDAVAPRVAWLRGECRRYRAAKEAAWAEISKILEDTAP